MKVFSGEDYSLISVVDTVRMEKVADIPIATPGLEASVLDSDKQLLYVNLVDAAVPPHGVVLYRVKAL